MENKDFDNLEEEFSEEKNHEQENGQEVGYSEESVHVEGGFNSNYTHNPFYDEIRKSEERGKYYGLGIASMVLGIVSITCCCFFGVPIILAVLAVVFSAIRMFAKSDGFALAGLITGIIGFVFNLIMIIAMFSGDTEFDFTEFESMLESLEVIRLLK